MMVVLARVAECFFAGLVGIEHLRCRSRQIDAGAWLKERSSPIVCGPFGDAAVIGGHHRARPAHRFNADHAVGLWPH